MIKNAMSPEEENVSEIQSLTDRVAFLNQSVDWWNTAMIWSLVFAAIAAVGVMVATRMVITRSKQLQDIQEHLIKAKDAQLSIDLRDKDHKIAAAGAKAIELEGQTEKLKAANLELEARFQPRRLTGEDSRKMSAILSRRPGLSIAIVSRIQDVEGKDFGDDLSLTFKDAKWETARYATWGRTDKGVFIATVEGTTLTPDVEKPIADALDAANIAHKTITISSNDLNQMLPFFQPEVLYLLVGARP
jgi:hypothetical protein